jgi:hypothetical protein
VTEQHDAFQYVRLTSVDSWIKRLEDLNTRVTPEPGVTSEEHQQRLLGIAIWRNFQDIHGLSKMFQQELVVGIEACSGKASTKYTHDSR